MVIPDWNAPPRRHKLEFNGESAPVDVRLARPLDRLAAVIIDICILLTPLYLLLSSPFKRLLTTSFLLNSEPDLFFMIVILVLLAVTLIVGYQSVSHYFFGRTLGKKVLGLRIEPVFRGEILTYWDCFFRACIWVFEVLLFGLPFLAVFSNGRRRTWHDRISDSVVVTVFPIGVQAPAMWERGVVRGVFSASMALVALFGARAVRNTLDSMRLERAFLAMTEKTAGECEIVTQNMEEREDSDHARLKLAMSLYAAGLADRSCLESEVEREVALQAAVGPVTYLAQAFVYADDAEVSNAYLDKVCEEAPDALECAMSRLISSWSDEDWPAVEQILHSAPKGSGFLEVWGVRHYMKQARYGSALSLLDELTARHELADFSLTQRVKALYNAYQAGEAQAALRQALVALPSGESRELGAWMCAQQLQSGCAALDGPACRHIVQDAEAGRIDFSNAHEAMARVLQRECREGGRTDYLSLIESAGDGTWRVFFRAALKAQREDRSASADLYTEVVESPDAPDLLRVEAARRLVEFASPRQMEQLLELWRGFESKEAWVKVGNFLFARLADTGNSKLGLKVARHLMNREALSPAGMHRLNAMLDSDTGAERRPASSRAREQVKQLLDGLVEESN